MCLIYGADILGFVVDYPIPVPWNLNPAAAKELMSSVSGRAKTCVVTGGSPENTIRLAKELKPDYIQLHASETLADVGYLVGKLGEFGVKIIKAVFPDTPDLEKTATDFCKTGIHSLLFDARTPNNAITGGIADLSLFRSLQIAAIIPIILAGGITPENVTNIVLMSKAEAIDIMTGLELSPGVKDEAKVAALFQALREMPMADQ
ncbi:MAG: hypothetical protein FWF18_03470 [Dehalococcoidia bacterium]|nr:hypothetical protein [Dehalococcoidia bacterium]